MLSIIVPVYNVEKYLNKCLDSISKQTSSDFEVIIVNDGSTDGCQQIIDQFCERCKNFKAYSKENGGLMSAYLYGIEKSCGDYIGFVDSDDYISPDFVQKMYDNNIEQADIVMCDRYDVFDDEIIYETKLSKLNGGIYYGDNIFNIYDNVLPPFSGWHITNARWNKIFKREIVLPNLKYCESKSKIMEDRFFTPPCMFSSKKFKYIKDPLYYYLHRTNSNHSSSSPRLYDAIKLLMMTQKQMLVDKGIYEKYEKQYEYACLNYVSLFIDRNIFAKTNGSEIKKYTSQLLSDDFISQLVKRNRKELIGKKGLLIKISFFFKTSFFFSIVSKLK